MVAESINGVRKGCANTRISSLVSHAESVLPLMVVIFNGVTGCISVSFNCPSKKSVTGKKIVESGAFSETVLISPSELQEESAIKESKIKAGNILCICKFTNKKKPLQGTKQRHLSKYVNNQSEKNSS